MRHDDALPPHVRLAMTLSELCALMAEGVSVVNARRDDADGDAYPASFEISARGLGTVRVTVEPRR